MSAVITDPKAVRLLVKESSRNLLMAFAAEPRSIADVAGRLGRRVENVFYHVRNFVDLGLLVVVREQRRRGKAIKFYRTVARTFLLPAECLESQFTAGLAEELQRALEHNFHRSNLEGVRISAGVDGAAEIELRAGSSRPLAASAGELWQVLRLDDAAVSALASDLRSLFEKYERLSGKGDEFLIHAAFAKR